jgi:DNA-3-methyladenine glycosylase I
VDERGLVRGDDGRTRCWWGAGDPAYHDGEWGRPVADDARLFELLCLEAFQSGLSWLTILRKREAFFAAFRGWDIAAVAGFGPQDVERLLDDARIVRNRAKIEATIHNASRCLELRRELGSFAAFVWSHEPHAGARPAVLDHAALGALASTSESIAMSRELKRRGWRWVGPTTVYSFMQAVGVVNDHLEGCDVRAEVEWARAAFSRPGAARAPS